MSSAVVLEKARSFVASQFEDAPRRPTEAYPRPCGPAITIAHQTGAGAPEIAERVAQLLQQTEPAGGRAWAVFERQVVEKALEEHHWPKTLARRIPEDRRKYVDDVLEELVGLRPPSWVVVPQVVETMLRLVEAGRVILIGRGATVVTSRLPHVFHVRLVASLAKRIERVQTLHALTAEQAAQFVEKTDRGRWRYVKANFHSRLDDHLLYDIVVNTDRLPCADAAGLIAAGARRFFQAGDQDLR